MRARPAGRSLPAMNFVLGVVIIAAAAAVAVADMLLVRRRAPDGRYFNDGDRASGMFGVLATGFSLLLGLSCSSPSPAMTRREQVRSRRRASWPNKSRRHSSSLRQFPES